MSVVARVFGCEVYARVCVEGFSFEYSAGDDAVASAGGDGCAVAAVMCLYAFGSIS